MAFGALGSLVLWVTIGRRMMLRYAGKSVINALLDPDEDTKEAIHIILAQAWTWFLTPSIKTGRKIQTKDEAGAILSEAEEILSPFQNLVGEIGRFIKMQFLATKGGEQKALKEALAQAAQDPNNPGASSLQNLLSAAAMGRKGLSLESLLPVLIQYFIGKKGAGGGGGGGSW